MNFGYDNSKVIIKYREGEAELATFIASLLQKIRISELQKLNPSARVSFLDETPTSGQIVLQVPARSAEDPSILKKCFDIIANQAFSQDLTDLLAVFTPIITTYVAPYMQTDLIEDLRTKFPQGQSAVATAPTIPPPPGMQAITSKVDVTISRDDANNITIRFSGDAKAIKEVIALLRITLPDVLSTEDTVSFTSNSDHAANVAKILHTLDSQRSLGTVVYSYKGTTDASFAHSVQQARAAIAAAIPAAPVTSGLAPDMPTDLPAIAVLSSVFPAGDTERPRSGLASLRPHSDTPHDKFINRLGWKFTASGKHNVAIVNHILTVQDKDTSKLVLRAESLNPNTTSIAHNGSTMCWQSLIISMLETNLNHCAVGLNSTNPDELRPLAMHFLQSLAACFTHPAVDVTKLNDLSFAFKDPYSRDAIFAAMVELNKGPHVDAYKPVFAMFGLESNNQMLVPIAASTLNAHPNQAAIRINHKLIQDLLETQPAVAATSHTRPLSHL